jgi:hypothetical protein
MQGTRFSQLSTPRQVLIRTCQRVNYGAIVNLRVVRGEIDVDSLPEVLLDFHLINDAVERPELELIDFVLPAESCRLMTQIDALADGLIERITVHDGIPRRVIVRRKLSREAVI